MHNIDMTNNRANIAFTGSRSDIWHSLGQSMAPGMSIQSWAQAAGLDWHAIKVPAIADLSSPQFSHIQSSPMRYVHGANHVVRSDNGHPLGYVSDRYQPVQPAELLEWFEQYISVDSRFQLDVAGSLKQGEIIWATATFNGGITVAGDQHIARLLMTTTFDGSGATINQGTMTRTVCNNTLKVALSDARAVVKTRHSTKFNADRVAQELSLIAQGFDQYRAMGDAMANAHMSREDIGRFFKSALDIPFDMPASEVSARKMNQFQALNAGYRATIAEGTQSGTAWAALNAVTRYVDHDRSTRNASDPVQARFMSAQFGSGNQLKARAVQLLMDHMGQKLQSSSVASPIMPMDMAVPVSMMANMAEKLGL